MKTNNTWTRSFCRYVVKSKQLKVSKHPSCALESGGQKGIHRFRRYERLSVFCPRARRRTPDGRVRLLGLTKAVFTLSQVKLVDTTQNAIRYALHHVRCFGQLQMTRVIQSRRQKKPKKLKNVENSERIFQKIGTKASIILHHLSSLKCNSNMGWCYRTILQLKCLLTVVIQTLSQARSAQIFSSLSALFNINHIILNHTLGMGMYWPLN